MGVCEGFPILDLFLSCVQGRLGISQSWFSCFGNNPQGSYISNFPWLYPRLLEYKGYCVLEMVVDSTFLTLSDLSVGSLYMTDSQIWEDDGTHLYLQRADLNWDYPRNLDSSGSYLEPKPSSFWALIPKYKLTTNYKAQTTDMISIIQNFSIYFGTRFVCTLYNTDFNDSVFHGTCARQAQNHVPQKEKS